MVKRLKDIADATSDSNLAATVRDSAQQIWLAGLGAFSKAQEEGANEAQVNKIKARGKQYNRGIEIFQSYFENTKPKQRNPPSLYKNLTLTVPPEMALKIMEHAGGGEFAAFVAAKRRGKGPATEGNRGAGVGTPKVPYK